MTGFARLDDLFTAIARGELTPVKPKGPTFGKKRFYQANLDGRNVWVKQYPDLDMPMLLTGDSARRELKFASSELPGVLNTLMEIPYIGASFSQAMVGMRDVGDELQRFGPPNLPTADQMQKLVQALARKDAMKIEKKDWMASPEHPLRVMKGLVLGFENDAESETQLLCRDLWPWMQGSLNNLKMRHPALYALILTSYSENRLEQALASLPGSLQHGDFYFSNIGFDHAGRPVVIDWETVMYGPPGLDLAMLIDGMPPLPFMTEVTGWYLTVFNRNSPRPITRAQLERTMELIGLRSLLVSGLIDLLRFALSDDSPVPEAARSEMLADYQSNLEQAGELRV